MFKSAITLYLTIFVLYVFFSRQPDYMDGVFTYGSIHYINDSAKNSSNPVAVFTVSKKEYRVNPGYLFRKFIENEKVEIIYENADPAKAAVYSWWGYWIRWQELLFSLLVLIASMYAAISITKNPTPESLIEQLEDRPAKKRKYSDLD